MKPSERIRLFTDVYLDGDVGSGAVERVVSRAVRPSAALVTVYGVVHQMTGNSYKVLLQLEGSYEGSRWVLLGSALQIGGAPAPGAASPLAVDCAFVRLRAYVPTTGSPLTRARFDAGLVFSEP